MWITLLPVLLQLLAELPNLIQKAEQAFSGKPGSGVLKKEFVEEAALTGLDMYQGVTKQSLHPDEMKAIQGSISKLIDTSVDIMNTAQVIQGPNPTPINPV